MYKLLFSLAIFLCAASSTLAQTTTIYIVRHAEKDMSDPNTRDPKLTGDGLKRASDLSTTLANDSLAAIFSTNYLRTIQTAEPVSKRTGLKINIYDPTNVTDLVTTINNQYKGKTILIVGHSNTIIHLVRSFGGNTSMVEIKDSEYSNLFRLALTPEKTTTTEMFYGN